MLIYNRLHTRGYPMYNQLSTQLLQTSFYNGVGYAQCLEDVRQQRGFFNAQC